LASFCVACSNGGGGGPPPMLAGSSGKSFLGIKTKNGAATLISGTGITGYQVVGLAFDPSPNRLYGADSETDQLLLLDRADGSATVVGALGFRPGLGLAFDPNTNTLYGNDGETLYVVDTATGAGTPVGMFGTGVAG